MIYNIILLTTINMRYKLFMDIKPAKRISQIKPYFFADLAKKITLLKNKNMDIIRLDIGSPDLPPEDYIIESLVEAARRPDMHGYGQPGGSASLKKAIADFYSSRFNVKLDPDGEVLALIGSKEGVFNLNNVYINQGDLVLLPDPCYPVYGVGALIAQAETYSMPLLAKNDFLPDLDDIPDEVVRRAKLMWLNYPNNPTGAIAPLSFFEKVLDFARKNEILIAHDAPYLDVCFDDYKASSILQVPGAKEVAIEFNSFSKMYNMAGWRVGMVVGNRDVIRLLQTYKSQSDSSFFKPIMEAAETALKGDQSWVSERNQIYKCRRDLIVNTLLRLGFSLEPPKASLYVWARIPKAWEDSIAFCENLLDATGVSVTPGVVYGKSGEGYVRISLVTPVERLKEAMSRLEEWMKEKV
jgi:LL-diaminopimelate aminotransferase